MRTSFQVAAAALLVACGTPAPPGPPAARTPGTLIVGVEGLQVEGLVGSLHVTTTVDDATTSDDTLDLVADPKSLPHEVKLSGPPGRPDAVLKVHVAGYAPGESAATGAIPILRRDARSIFMPGATSLLRVTLESSCLTSAGSAVSCREPQTCIAGRCQSDDAWTKLEPYTPDWSIDVPDVCKPAGHGAPVVVVGTGQTDFLPLTSGQTVQAEKGPQGGHHLWIAMRAQNLKQSGSITTLNAVQPDTGVTIPPSAFVFTLAPDEGGYCKLFGLRYQLDNGGIDYKQFLGKPLDVTVTVRDRAGAEATGVAHIVVAPTVLGE